jgi:hypothetical protein
MLAALGLLALAYLAAGSDQAGAHAAVLGTARLSGLVFALALVTRGFATAPPGWRQTLGSWRVPLQRAFVGAHFVHFGAVLRLARLDPSHELHRLAPPMLAVTAAGLVHISLVGLAAGATADQPARRWLDRVSFYLAWAIFVLAFGGAAAGRAVSVVMLVTLVGAMATRLVAGAAGRRRLSGSGPAGRTPGAPGGGRPPSG